MKTSPLNLISITEVCLYSNKIREAEEFYSKQLGLNLIESTEDHVFFRLDNQVLLIFDPNKSKEQNNLPPHFAMGYQHIAFTAQEGQYQIWKKQLIESGIEILNEHHWPKNNLKSFYFRDPDGHVIEILEGNIWI